MEDTKQKGKDSPKVRQLPLPEDHYPIGQQEEDGRYAGFAFFGALISCLLFFLCILIITDILLGWPW